MEMDLGGGRWFGSGTTYRKAAAANPLIRKLFRNQRPVLLTEEGMTALDIGCAMGFFSLPLARMVGEMGKVVCVDAQEKMLGSLRKRARQAGLDCRIIPHLCRKDSLALNAFEKKIDFALVFAVVHEAPDAFHFFSEVSRALKPGAKCLVAEPKMHVSGDDFAKTLALASDNGFRQAGRPKIAWSRAALLVKRDQK